MATCNDLNKINEEKKIIDLIDHIERTAKQKLLKRLIGHLFCNSNISRQTKPQLLPKKEFKS